MQKIKILNTSQFDVVVDIGGNNDPKDKIIIHPNSPVVVQIPSSLRHIIRNDKRLKITMLKN